MDSVSPVWLLVSSLLSGLVAVAVTLYVRARQDKKEIKRDVLRRLAGNRHVISRNGPPPPPSGEPFVALNESFVVFAEDPAVLRALTDLRTSNGRGEHIVALIKRMASAAGVPIKIDDAYISDSFLWRRPEQLGAGQPVQAGPARPTAPAPAPPAQGPPH